MTETTEIALVGAASALFGGILGGVLSGVFQLTRDWFLRPRLRIDYIGQDPNKIDVDFKKDDGTHVANVYIRARVRNIGRRPAKGALVFLTSLKEVHRSGKTTETSFHDSVALSWAGWNFEPRDIPPAPVVCFYVDLIRVSKHEPGWNFSAKRLFGNEAAIKSYSGTYRCQLTLTADDAKPAICEIDVTYERDWHTLRAVETTKG
jgi:hypothetical protein